MGGGCGNNLHRTCRFESWESAVEELNTPISSLGLWRSYLENIKEFIDSPVQILLRGVFLGSPSILVLPKFSKLHSQSHAPQAYFIYCKDKWLCVNSKTLIQTASHVAEIFVAPNSRLRSLWISPYKLLYIYVCQQTCGRHRRLRWKDFLIFVALDM